MLDEFDKWYKDKGYTVVSSPVSKKWCCLNRNGWPATPEFWSAGALKMHLVQQMNQEQYAAHSLEPNP